MAEITAQDLYNQLTPLEKQQYDGVMGMGGFKQRYEENPTSQFVLGDANYAKFKAVADAEAAVPDKGLFSIFSSASAAEPDKISSVSGTPGFETIVNADGTISIVPVGTSSNLPFDVGSRLFDQFNTATTIPNQTSFDPRSIQSIFPTNFPTGITASSAAVPFGTSVDNIQGFTDKEDFSRPEEKKSSGVLDLMGMLIPGFNFLRNLDGQPYERFDPRASIKGGIYSIGNFNQPASMVNDFYNPRTGLNRFERAQKRYETTGSIKDLFGSSRTGAEFFRKLRERKAANQRALETVAKKKRDIQQFTGGGGGDGPQIQDRPATTGQGLTTSQFQAFRN